MNARRWLHEHSLKLLAIRDTPEAIAGGVAIGIFFGFMPLFGLKTLLAILFAWLTRSNILAAVLAGALHDVILPAMPVIYLWQYDVGYWMLSKPHHWPSMKRLHLGGDLWGYWKLLTTIGRPLLLGGFVCSFPCALLSWFITKPIVERHHRKRDAAQRAAHQTDSAEKAPPPNPT